MPYLPTSLRLPSIEGEGITYNPYPESRAEKIGRSLQSMLFNILSAVEQARQQQRQKTIIENILQGKTQDEWLPKYQEPPPAKSLLGRIFQRVGGLVDVGRPPAEITPIEQAIAEARLKGIFAETPEERELKKAQADYYRRRTGMPKIYKMGNKLVQYNPLLDKTEVIFEIPTEGKDLQVWKQAEEEVATALGGRNLIGLDEETRTNYYAAIKDRFETLKSILGNLPSTSDIGKNTTEIETTKEQFTPEEERLIQENMKAYGKPRDVTIAALRKKRLLK